MDTSFIPEITPLDGTPAGTRTPFTLGDALARYQREITPYKKGKAQETRRIRAWQQTDLAARPFVELTKHDFKRHRDARLKAGASRSTVRLELAIISHLYNVAIEDWDYDDVKNPISNLRLPPPKRGRERRLAAAEEPALLRAANTVNPRLKPIILLALETAMRRGELVKLRWLDVNFANSTLLVRDSKNGDNRTVPLSTTAVAILRELQAPAGRVFDISANWISRRFHQACQLAQIEDLRLHDMRHEATSRLFELGSLTDMEIAHVTGHKTMQMLRRYAHLRAANLVAKLG